MPNKKILDVYFQTTENYTIRTEHLEDKEYLVVPVTMMVEGVHSGSHGPILHLSEELGRYPESWDGIPVTIGHPQINGSYVSANNPDVLEDWAVGRIFNTNMDGQSLRAEAWLDKEKLERVSPEVVNKLENGEIIEVSVGVFSDEEETQGSWNFENYIAIARNHRPNHLALLPDEVGACSIEDGCGIRVNKKGGTKMTEKKVILNVDNQQQVIKELNLKGFSVFELGYKEVATKVTNYVYGLDGNGLDNYVEEIYDNYFVYRQTNSRIEPRSTKLYKQSYELNEADDLVLVGNASHVKKDVSYTEIPMVNKNGHVKTQRINPKRKTVMANEKCSECVKKLVDGLIANKATAWSEDDRETLQALSEDTLEKMTPQTQTEAPKEVVKEVKTNTAKVTREELLAVLSEKPLTTEESLKLMAPEAAAIMKESMKVHSDHKAKLVSGIVANTKEWTEDELKLKEVEELQKIYKLVSDEESPTVFVGGGSLGGHTKVQTNGVTSGPKTRMVPDGVEVKEK